MTQVLTRGGRCWKLWSLCSWTIKELEDRTGHSSAGYRSYGLPSGVQESDGRENQKATPNKERSSQPSLGPPTLQSLFK